MKSDDVYPRGGIHVGRLRVSDIMILRIAAGCLAGSLLVLAFPNFEYTWLAWIGLSPLLISLGSSTWRQGAWLGFLTQIIFLVGIFWWMNRLPSYKWSDFVLMALYVGIYGATFGMSYCVLRSAVGLPATFLAPSLWVALEYIRAHAGFLSLPWAFLGHSQYQQLTLIQIASIAGVYGISFCLVMSNGLCADLYHWTRQRIEHRVVPHHLDVTAVTGICLPLIGTATILTGYLVYGWYVLNHRDHPSERIDVTVVQGNIAQDHKWQPEQLQQNFEQHIRLTRESVERNQSSLIVWPEGTAQAEPGSDLDVMQTLSQLARDTHTSILAGQASRPKFGERKPQQAHWVNSAVLFSDKGAIQGVYHKIRLVPFGEYLPYRDIWPWPTRLAALAGHFVPGQQHKIFMVNGVRFATLICWESLFPELAGQFVRNGAQLLINIGNEAWFGDSAAPYQFLSMNVFRAVENRVGIARAANTGISAFIDPSGRIVGRVQRPDGKDVFIEGTLTASVTISNEMTFYARYGDVILIAYLSMAGLALLCFNLAGKLKTWLWVLASPTQGEHR